ncbi:MAG: hypothetical protein ACK4HV_09095 [Parachlamydiaceae bacterium]
MKKQHYKKFILIGLSAAFTLGAADAKDVKTPQEAQDAAYGNMNYHLMTDDDIKLELRKDGLKLYDSLDEEGKALARKVASQRCAKTNECKGLNACATDDNKCAGQGTCKGTSKCGFSNKDLAVKVVYDKLMKEKRSNLTK